jgi:glycosyltransferase involved in cell wall biosynthesis
MRLVFFTFGGVLYGANLSMIDLIVALQAKGVESLVVHAQQGPISSKLHDLGIPSRMIPFATCVHWRSDKPLWHPRRWMSSIANTIRALRKEQFNRKHLKELVAVTRGFSADLVLSNASSTIIGLRVAKLLRIPHVWHVREFGDLDWDYYPDGGFRRRRKNILESAKVLCVSKAVAQHISRQSMVDNGRITVLYNSIASQAELALRASKSRVTSKNRPFTFGLTGFVKYSKGQFEAVSALRRVTDLGEDVQLIVAGDGAIAELKNHAKAEGVADRVFVLGHVSDLSEVYRRADCGLMCSVAEGFGRVTAEFMSWGKPVIGRNSGATPEIIDDSVNGLLYDGTIAGLSSAMLRIIREDGLLEKLSRGALHKVSSDFCHEAISEAFVSEVLPQLAKN